MFLGPFLVLCAVQVMKEHVGGHRRKWFEWTFEVVICLFLHFVRWRDCQRFIIYPYCAAVEDAKLWYVSDQLLRQGHVMDTSTAYLNEVDIAWFYEELPDAPATCFSVAFPDGVE